MLFRASRPSHQFLFTLAAVSLLVGGLGRTAAATVCTTDSDCVSGYQCVLGTAVAGVAATGGATSIGVGAPSASDGTGGVGGSVASPGAGAATGSVCSGGDNCASPASPPTRVPSGPATDAGAGPLVPTEPNPLPTVPPPIVTGICQLSCTAAAPCPAPLTCQAQAGTCSGGAGVGPDGTVTTTPTTCTPGRSICAWVPPTCVADRDCASSLYQCVKVGETGWCSGSGQACAVDTTCPPPPPPTCGTTAIMNCLPKLIDCGAGQACPADWSCFDFSTVGGVPSTWGSVASNKSCLPDPIIPVVQASGVPGTTRGDTAGTGTVGIGETNDTGGTSGTRGGVPVIGPGASPLIPGPATQDGANGGAGGGSSTDRPSGTAPSLVSPVPPSQGGATASAGGEASVAARSGGCSYGGGSGQRGLWLALAMTGLVARLTRRRPRVR